MQMSGGVSQASPPLFLFGSQNFEEWLIPFIYEKNGKAQFEQDCMNFDGEKDLSLLLKLGFQRVLSNPQGPVSFTDEITSRSATHLTTWNASVCWVPQMMVKFVRGQQK